MDDYKTPKTRIEKKRKGKEYKPYSSKHIRKTLELKNKKVTHLLYPIK